MTEKTGGLAGFWVFVCLLLLTVVLWGWHLDTPFSRVLGFSDYISNLNGSMSKNHVRYGLAETRGDQIRNIELADRAEWVHYNNHPGTLVLLAAGVFELTGSQEPWTKRLISLFASLGSLFFLAGLARRAGLDRWWVLALFLSLPLVLIHGLNLSYEPLALFWMLGMVLLRERGWHWRLLPLLWLGGLIDFPVLYLGPAFALQALWDARRVGLGKAILYGTALAGCCLASLGTHLLHVAWTMGGLQATSGQDWWSYVLLSLRAKNHATPWGEFVSAQGSMFLANFTLPVLLLGLLGLMPWSRWLPSQERRSGPGRAAIVFLIAGTLHLFLFREHAMVHDFWLTYYAPFFALTGTAALLSLPRALALSLLAFTAILGMGTATRYWQDRAAVPVREVAADVQFLFDSDVILHSLLAPPGWSLESFRGHPVLDAGDLLQQPFAQYLDRLGSLGYLERPQRLFVPVDALQTDWARDLDSLVLPGLDVVERLGLEVEGQQRKWRIYDLGPILLDPGKSPYLLDKSLLLPGNDQVIGPAERQRLVDRARKFLVLRQFEPETEISYLDGREGPYEILLGRRIRSSGEAELASATNLVAWPGTVWAERLRVRHGDEVEEREIRAVGKSAKVLVWRLKR